MLGNANHHLGRTHKKSWRTHSYAKKFSRDERNIEGEYSLGAVVWNPSNFFFGSGNDFLRIRI